MKLYELLNRYKELTKKIIIEVTKEAEIEEFVKEREEIILSIEKMNYEKEDIIGIIIDLGLIEEDKKMFDAIENERVNIKNELNEIKLRRFARNKYGSNSSVPVFFNKKI